MYKNLVDIKKRIELAKLEKINLEAEKVRIEKKNKRKIKKLKGKLESKENEMEVIKSWARESRILLKERKRELKKTLSQLQQKIKQKVRIFFCILITFNNPLKACFSNKIYIYNYFNTHRRLS